MKRLILSVFGMTFLFGTTAEAATPVKGKAFLAADKNKPGVKALPSGLQYKMLQP